MAIPTRLHDALTRSAAADAERPLLIAPKSTHRYGEAERLANQVARALAHLGVVRGDRVALLWRNTIEYVAGFYGILRAGAIAVPVNHAIGAAGLRHLLRDSGARVVLAEGHFGTALQAGLVESPPLEIATLLTDQPDIWQGTIEGSVLELRAALEGESDAAIDGGARSTDDAAIIYTSGSTGKPRGAVLTHRSLIANTESIVQYLSLTSADRVMAILPFFYVYGKSLLNTHVWAGGSLIVGSDLLFPNSVLTRMQKEGATGFSGVPSTFAILLNRSKLGEVDLPTLRYVTQAGGAMAPDLTRRLMEKLPGKQIFVMYGATEASARLSYLDPRELPRKLGSIGKAIPGVELRVLHENGTECAPREPGELVARGENIMRGYWNAPEETAAVLDTLGFHTGDLAFRDEEGFFYIVGRTREMIKCGANRISPLEIEEKLLAHDSVHEAAVIGVPDEILGEAIVAFVAPRGGATIEEQRLLEHLAASLPEYKVPRTIVVRAELPKSGAGKIHKIGLKEAWLAEIRAG